MYCNVHFRTLICVLAHYVSSISKVSCNNISPKSEIYKPSDEVSTNTNTSRSGGVFDQRLHANGTTSVMPGGFIEEGPADFPVNGEKNNETTPSRISVQSDAPSDKILQLDEEYDFRDTSVSTEQRKEHKRRKGAPPSELYSEKSLLEHTTHESVKNIVSEKKSPDEVNSVTTLSTSTIPKLLVNFTVNSSAFALNIDNSKNSSQEHLNQGVPGVNATSHSSATSLDLKPENVQNATSENTLDVIKVLPFPKPKPEFTRDDSDTDDHSAYSNPESDYVIPIVATIFAAPLIIVLAMFLYKKSKEFWERRHYRRMDFLIDGMYND